jgi:Fic family protein
MTKDKIARIINPEHPWVYAPTTAPTKIIMNDGRELVGYFQYTQKSDDLGEKNYYTFVEFGENVNFYRATGDPKYITEVNGSQIAAVEYPASLDRDISLESLMRKINSLTKEIENRILPSREAILFAPRFRLDWGIQIDPLTSSEFSSGDTKQVVAEGLSQARSHYWKINSYSRMNKVTGLLEEFLTTNKLTERQIKELYTLIFQLKPDYRIHDVTIHQRKPSDFNFTPVEIIAEEIQELISWYNESVRSPDTHPVILSGMFHYRLVAIHPFADGNGRLARVISSLILLKYKIPPPRIGLEDRVYYLDALEKADHGNFEAWIKYFGREVLRSMEALLLENPRR